MYAAYDGIGIIIRNSLHRRHQTFPNFGSVRTANFTCDVYTNDSLHGVCFPTVNIINLLEVQYSISINWLLILILILRLQIHEIKKNQNSVMNQQAILLQEI